jgi:hypothetical protein
MGFIWIYGKNLLLNWDDRQSNSVFTTSWIQSYISQDKLDYTVIAKQLHSLSSLKQYLFASHLYCTSIADWLAVLLSINLTLRPCLVQQPLSGIWLIIVAERRKENLMTCILAHKGLEGKWKTSLCSYVFSQSKSYGITSKGQRCTILPNMAIGTIDR